VCWLGPLVRSNSGHPRTKMLDDEALLAADPSAKSLIDSGVPRQEVIAGLRGQASGDASAAATPFAAAVITPPSVEELAVAENRKMVLRALDSKISKQDAPSALAAIELALKLVTNIISQPSEPKYKKFRANNPAISQKLLRCPGGQDLILALGFRTKVVEFEEQWVADDGPLLMRTLAECTPLLENYRDLERKKIDRDAKQRQEKLANSNDERLRTLAAIEEDKANRRERERMRVHHPEEAALAEEPPAQGTEGNIDLT